MNSLSNGNNDHLSVADCESIVSRTLCPQSCLSWLETNQLAEVEEFEHQQKVGV